jgi:hypothetical protein
VHLLEVNLRLLICSSIGYSSKETNSWSERHLNKKKLENEGAKTSVGRRETRKPGAQKK